MVTVARIGHDGRRPASGLQCLVNVLAPGMGLGLLLVAGGDIRRANRVEIHKEPPAGQDVLIGGCTIGFRFCETVMTPCEERGINGVNGNVDTLRGIQSQGDEGLHHAAGIVKVSEYGLRLIVPARPVREEYPDFKRLLRRDHDSQRALDLGGIQKWWCCVHQPPPVPFTIQSRRWRNGPDRS